MKLDPGLLTIVILLVVSWVVTVVLLSRILVGLRRQDPSPGQLLLQSQIDGLREQVRGSLESGRLDIDRHLERTHRVMGEVREGLATVDHQARSVAEVARDLRGLQELMRSPNFRGGIAEYMLAELLAQVLPVHAFDLQHEFSGGERVDAVLRVGERLVPVDAKFPLDNFQRMRAAEAEADTTGHREGRRAFRADVRRHVDAIAKRYIRPEEGTYEFAMMYLPAEAIHRELVLQEGDDGLDLLHYSLARRVVPVSPQSFYAYLQVIVLGLRGLSIEARSREIMDRIERVRNRLDRFGESFEVMLRHLGNAQRQGEEASKRLVRLETALDGLAERSAAGEQSEDR